MAKQVQLTPEMIQNIEQYGDQIITLDNFVKVVRQNPGYQLGSIGNKGIQMHLERYGKTLLMKWIRKILHAHGLK